MSPGGNRFDDDFEKSLRDAVSMSDADLEGLMGGVTGPAQGSTDHENLESGARVEGTVVEVHDQEVLVELDGKTLGVVDLDEYGDDSPPSPGTRLRAEFVRFDDSRDVCVLTTKAVRTAIAWEELHVGMLLEGTVLETNRGGLTLQIKDMRAFMPISQIARERVEDTEQYVGQKFRCEVTQVDRAERNLVVSRRAILEREGEADRRRVLENIVEGEIRRGRVTRVIEHGAFIDLGGVDGLLHASKIHQQLRTRVRTEPPKVGDVLEVEVVRVDLERGRVGLDFRAVEESSWETIIEGYAVGEEVTGWISRHEEGGAVLSLEEGLEAFIPAEHVGAAADDRSTGSLVRGVITAIDRGAQRVVVKPV